MDREKTIRGKTYLNYLVVLAFLSDRHHLIIVGMVEDEEDYVKNLSILVTCFLRPLRMAASSKKPIITHDDVNSIFLNR